MSKLYSLDKVMELADGDADFIKILVETFLEEIPPDLSNMAKAVELNKAKEAYQYAHKMKPNFLLFGIDVVDQVRLIESWSVGKITQEDAKPALLYVQEVALKALTQLKEDFK